MDISCSTITFKIGLIIIVISESADARVCEEVERLTLLVVLVELQNARAIPTTSVASNA